MFARSVTSNVTRRSVSSNHSSDLFSWIGNDLDATYKPITEPDYVLPNYTYGRFKTKMFSERNQLFQSLDGTLDETVTVDEVQAAWKYNYQEAAIYLEEGLKNEKLNYHPRNSVQMKAYQFVHNDIYHLAYLMASVALLLLTMTERPAVPHLGTPPWQHAPLEIVCLLVIGIELIARYVRIGGRQFIVNPKFVIKSVIILVMIGQASYVAWKEKAHMRGFRAIRPIFLLDSHFCSETRRTLRHFIKSLPPVIDMVAIMVLIIVIFSFIGFHMFHFTPHDQHFTSFGDSFANMFIIISSGK
ncbi:Two pore calcium channel protein 1 [Halotydeus destructor]|nr:Two pore calcium channel protein 1 [Halotydeus destructor]